MPRIAFSTYGYRLPGGDVFSNSVLLTNAGAYLGARQVGEVFDLSPAMTSSGVDWEGVGRMAAKVSELPEDVEVLHCQAGVALEVMQAWRARFGARPIVLQRDSTHAQAHLDLMRLAMERHGLKWVHQYEDNGHSLLQRELAEYELADRIFTLSRWVTSTFKAHALGGKTSQFSSQLAEGRHWWPAERKPAELPFTACYVGSLGIRKGTLYLLDAWRIFWAHNPHSRLLLAGVIEGPDHVRRHVEGRIRSTPGCVHLGWTNPPDGTRALYHQSHVFVSTSVEDGSTMPGVEAAMCGLPIVATANAGIDLLVDGETGIQVPAFDPHSTASALERVARDPEWRARMSFDIRLAAQRCDVSDYAGNYARSLSRVLAEFTR